MLLAVNVVTPVAPSAGAEAAEIGPAGAAMPVALLVVMPAGNVATPPEVPVYAAVAMLVAAEKVVETVTAPVIAPKLPTVPIAGTLPIPAGNIAAPPPGLLV